MCPSWSALLDYVVCLAQSTRTCTLHFSLFFRRRSWVTMDFSDTSSDELEEHNAWNPMLELFFHAHIGFSWKYLSMKRKRELHSRVILLLTPYATKVRPAVLNRTPWGTIAPQEGLHEPSPDAQTRSSDGGSGLTLFPSQCIVRR